MKIAKLIVLLIVLISISSCEEVVDVDLNTAPPKLVIEASINWTKGTVGNVQKIKLTTTTDFFSNTIPTVSGALITIKNSANTTFVFTEIGNSGDYLCTNFVPTLNETYTLQVISKGETYSATETLISVTPITKIEQKNDGGFTGKDIEVKAFFMDPLNETNYFLYKYAYSNVVKKDYYTDNDEFTNGNENFSISQNDALKKGDVVQITHYGISKSYYNYMSKLVSIAGNSGGSPFQSPPATVRGNIVNNTKNENYPLGFFALGEIDTRDYIIQ